MDSNNPNYVPTNTKNSTKRRLRRNPPQLVPQNPNNYPPNAQNYFHQAPNFPPNYNPNLQYNPMNYNPNYTYTGSQTQFPTHSMSQNFSTDFNVFDQSTPDGGESSNENEEVEYDEEDDEEEFEIPSSQQNFTELLSQQSVPVQHTLGTQGRQSEKKSWTRSEIKVGKKDDEPFILVHGSG